MVKVKALVNTKESDIKSFAWKNIISRYGVPHTIKVDTNSQFIGSVFSAFYEQYDIPLLNLTPHYLLS